MLSRSMVLLCAVLFLLLPTQAAAQTHDPLPDLTALFNRSFVPVEVKSLGGPATLDAGAEGVFSARTNLDVATLPARLAWDFGDGTTARSLHARHRYAAPGTYTVRFTISNERSSATDSLVVRVLPLAPDSPGMTQAPAAPAPPRTAGKE